MQLKGLAMSNLSCRNNKVELHCYSTLTGKSKKHSLKQVKTIHSINIFPKGHYKYNNVYGNKLKKGKCIDK